MAKYSSKKSRSSVNMSIRQQERNGAMRPLDLDAPKCYADIAPRGPQGVKNQVIGVLLENGEGGIVMPDPSFKETNFGPVRIEKNNLNGAPFKMTVVCEILNPASENRDYRGKIVEVLGDMGNNDVKMLAVMRQFGLASTFPDEVVEEVKDLPVNPDPELVDKEIAAGRHDLRDLLTITIDGEEAKDLDDAISIERLPGGNYKLYVHIADVSNYVKENTALDREAFLRATSVYLVDRVIPMLPPKLSNGLCSLNPNVDRLTMTAEMLIDDNGITYDGSIYESVIRSDRRMSYKETFRILTEPKDSDAEEYGPIVPMLSEMKVLAEILKRMRDGKGAINFDFPEPKVILNDDGSVKDIMPYPINFCNGIIEQFMICANEFVAERFATMNYPFVYRVHEDPDALKIAKFCNVARNFGASGRLSGKITPLMISEYMATIRDDEARPMLDTVLLRSMAKARYAPDNLGHFGLASKFYCHFTSPIRRYPDLYIHRIIKSYIHEEKKRRHFAGLVSNVSDHSSDMERNSVEAERASDAVKMAEFMADKVGEHYMGKITSIIGAGVFVMLPNTVEGFVPFRTMSDHYLFDERSYRAIGSRTGRKLTIGMDAPVVVAAVDTEMHRIDFVFAEGFEGGSGRSQGSGERKAPIGRRKAKTLAKKRGKRSRRSF
ncbi:ribonuclease R [Oscillospiraceae bacterium]|nr:ribonuclease R [Oscillospiraceae bacterium]